ncbi:hypothetical protein [Frigoribacterium faeni]|uniref:hypothetical protein n=1 Tax=Frigoribacterium faeni TaxID=145483 RepID=UPI00141BEE51|nr:hypothetical protein [Frigoribacterium faeni]NIJ05164.1 hypothetical protein [Frigoribacterium faeni]
MTDDDHRPPAASPSPAAAPAARDAARAETDARPDTDTDSTALRPPAPRRRGSGPDSLAVVGFVGAVLLATGVQIGGTVLLVLLSTDGGTGPLLAGVAGLGLLVLPPLVLGAVLAAWDVPASDAGRRRHRRFLAAVLGAEVAGAALVLVSAVLSGSPAWLPASFVAVGAVLTLVALWAGPALGERAGRRAAEQAESPTWRPPTRTEVRRAVRTVALTFALTFVPVAVGLSFVPGEDDDGGAQALLVAAGLAFIAASCACLVVSLRMQRTVTSLFGRDQERARRVGRAVMGRRAVELGPDDERLAARWASMNRVAYPVQIAQSELLFAGLLCQQLPLALSDDAWIATRVLVVVLPVAMVAFVPLFLVRHRRLRRFADDHAHVLDATTPEEAPTPSPGTGPASEARP